MWCRLYVLVGDWVLMTTTETSFRIGEPVVYFSHGVGIVTDIETVELSGSRSHLYVISFVQDKMVLKVPVNSKSIRAICSVSLMNEALAVLKQRARKNNILWSKRMTECSNKVNSGDPRALAEVIRDIYRNIQTADYSFTERSVFENAMKRLAAELAYVDDVPMEQASDKISSILESTVKAEAG